MSHRRRRRRFRFSDQLRPEEMARLLRLMGAPCWMGARIARARGRAQQAALHHPARWPGGQTPSDV